jgi:hypothetical protein
MPLIRTAAGPHEPDPAAAGLSGANGVPAVGLVGLGGREPVAEGGGKAFRAGFDFGPEVTIRRGVDALEKWRNDGDRPL